MQIYYRPVVVRTVCFQKMTADTSMRNLNNAIISNVVVALKALNTVSSYLSNRCKDSVTTNGSLLSKDSLLSSSKVDDTEPLPVLGLSVTSTLTLRGTTKHGLCALSISRRDRRRSERHEQSLQYTPITVDVYQVISEAKERYQGHHTD